ncbi:MAG: hypothetical protein VZR28_03675 [Candidatus Cryptobacteroides sp.]|nr:hypothetical protein [Candidatus Cryptobacteroides sp.]
MKKTNNTKLITVGELVKELAGYEKKHWDWNVEITAEGVEGEEEDPTCIITGMGLDEDGDLRIEIEEEWAGGGDYYVGEILEQLRDFDASTRVYLAGGGLLFSIDSQGSIFAETDEDDDTLSSYDTAFGEYKEEPKPARKPSEGKKKKSCATPWGFILLMLLAIAAAIAAICLGIYYNIIAICIIAFVALIAIMVVVARVETCPYCGSIRLKKEKIDPRFNIANWSVKCKKCGEDFFME